MLRSVDIYGGYNNIVSALQHQDHDHNNSFWFDKKLSEDVPRNIKNAANLQENTHVKVAEQLY